MVFTYGWELFVRQIVVADLVDLGVENRYDLLRAHHVDLETQISQLVKVRTANRCLNEG